MILPIVEGVTLFLVYYNKAQRGSLVVMIKVAKLWYVCLGYIGLDLLRKTALVTKGMPDFSSIRPKHIAYKSYNITKLLY